MNEEKANSKSSNVVCRNGSFTENTKSFKSSFPIYITKWNPVYDCLAVASVKGDICLRRSGYKKSWKINIEKVRGIYYEELGCFQREYETETTVKSIEWSPNGLYLAVSLGNGYLHILDFESGQVRYSQKFNFIITQMKWQWYVEHDSIKKFSQTFYESSKVNVRFPNFYEEEKSNREKYGNFMAVKDFCTESIIKDLFGTILFVVTDKNLLIHALACGIFPVTRFEAPFDKFGNFDSTNGIVNDVNYNISSKMLFVSYSGMAMTYSSYPNEIGIIKPNMTEQSMGINTYVIEFKIDFGTINSIANVFLLACRWAHLYFSAIYIRSVFDYAISDWREQMSIISNMFKCSSDDGNQVKNLSKELAKLLMFGLSSPKAMYHFRFKIKPEGVRTIHDIIHTKFTALAKLINGPMKIGLIMVNEAHTRLSEETKCLENCFSYQGTSQLFKYHEDSVYIQALSRVIDDFQRSFEKERNCMLQLVRFMYSCQPITANYTINRKQNVEVSRIVSANYPLDYNGMIDYLVTDKMKPKYFESPLKKFLVDCGLPENLDGDGIDEFINSCGLANYKQVKINEYLALDKKSNIVREDINLKFVDEMYCEINNIDKNFYKEALNKVTTIPDGIMEIFNILERKIEGYVKNGIVEGTFVKIYNIELAHPIGHDKFLIFPCRRTTKEYDIDGNMTRCSVGGERTSVFYYLVFRKTLGTASWNCVNSNGTIKIIKEIGVPDVIYNYDESNDLSSCEGSEKLTVITTGLEKIAKKRIVDCTINDNNCLIGLIKLNESTNPDLNYPFVINPNFGEMYVENSIDDYFVCDQLLVHNKFNIGSVISKDKNKVMCFKISTQKLEKHVNMCK